MTARIILLLLFIGIPALLAWIGYKKGFLEQLIGMLTLVIALVVTYMFSSYVSEWIGANTPLHDRAEVYMAGRIDEFLSRYDAESGEQVREALSGSLLPGSLFDPFLEKMEDGAAATRADYVSRLSTYAADVTVRVCGVLATFIGALILVGILMWVVGILDKLPGIRQANQGLGLLLGLLKGVIFVWILCCIIAVTAHTETGQALNQAISEDPLLSVIYNYAMAFTGMLTGGLMG